MLIVPPSVQKRFCPGIRFFDAMANVRWYAVVYVALLSLAFSKWAFFEFLAYNLALGLTMITASMKTILIVAYYQHLRHEPRILTILMLTAFVAVAILAVAASFSIT